jgi:hypothetical protein
MKSHHLLPFLFLAFSVSAQNAPKSPTLQVYLDEFNGPGSFEYQKTEVRYVNYVADRFQCDVQVQEVYEPLQNGAAQYRYYFIGYRKFANQRDTVIWHADPNESTASIREKSVRAFKRGLIRYLLQTPEGELIEYNLSGEPDYQNTKDPWNLWTMKLNLTGSSNGSFHRQQSGSGQPQEAKSSTFFLNPGVSAWRIGEKWRGGFNATYKIVFNKPNLQTQFDREQNFNFDAYYVHTLSNHLSAGGAVKYEQYGKNMENRALLPKLGLEYNFFSYDQFFKRRLLVGATTGLNYSHFPPTSNSTTYRESIYANYTTIQKWGYITTGVTVYDDLYKNQNGLHTEVGFTGGLNLSKNLFITFNYLLYLDNTAQTFYLQDGSSIKNKNYTSQYNASIGLSYYFGSGYRSIVNPRMSGF